MISTFPVAADATARAARIDELSARSLNAVEEAELVTLMARTIRVVADVQLAVSRALVAHLEPA